MAKEEKVKDWLVDHVIEVSLTSGAGAILALLVITESKIEGWMSVMGPKISFRVLLTIFLLILISGYLGVYFLSRPRFKFLPKVGVFIDVKRGLYYCPACMTNKVHAPLKQNERGWYCATTTCRSFFPDPDYKQQKVPQSPQPGRGNSGMAM